MKKEMNKDVFWTLIDEVRLSSTDPDVRYENMIGTLSMLDDTNIAKFYALTQTYMEAAKRNKVWAACNVMGKVFATEPADSFNDFVSGVVSQGKDVYMKAMADPDTLADVENFDNVSYWIAAEDAYRICGYGSLSVSDERCALTKAEQSAILSEIEYAADIDDDLTKGRRISQRLPRLCKKYKWDKKNRFVNL